jgi:hypothetical protein
MSHFNESIIQEGIQNLHINVSENLIGLFRPPTLDNQSQYLSAKFWFYT